MEPWLMRLARELTSWSLPTASAKLKTDKIDSEILAQLLRCDLIPQLQTGPKLSTD